jgi:mannan endo-1,4-beta-mannosidase
MRNAKARWSALQSLTFLATVTALWGCGYDYVPYRDDKQAATGGLNACNDSPPSSDYTCQQQAEWGKCGEPWMQGHCDTACGRCSTQGSCNDSPPSSDYTCQQQAEWGKCGEPWMQGFCESVCGRCGGSPNPGNPPGPGASSGFKVNGRHLYDRCGEKVVLRGVNEMIIWLPSGTDGLPEYQEIAKTGANSVRIVWSSSGSAAQLDETIQNALNNQLIPMIENHDATGNFGRLGQVVDYWTRGDILQVISKYSDRLLLNIANEAGASVSDDDFKWGYKNAISRLRNAGVTTPLIIDGTSWGQDTAQMFRAGPEVADSDPQRNVMFSVHLYDAGGVTADKMYRLTDQIAAWNYPMIIGEFANGTPGACDKATDYRTIMALSQQKEISWMPWSWGSVGNQDCGNQFNMGNGWFDSLQGWGLEVAVTDANSIRNTSRRPRSVVTGSCQ